MTRPGTLALLVLAVTAVPAAAQFPVSAPAGGPLRPFQLPALQKATLANGLAIIVVENHELPILSLTLSIPAGSRRDPAGREGVATLMADLLTHGTSSRTVEQIAARAEGSGLTLAAEADMDFVTVVASGLVESAGALFDLTSDAIQNPAFPLSEFDIAKKRYAASLERDKTDPQALADRDFARLLFGDHPYARRASTASVQAITRDDVVRQASSWLKPGGALLVVVGDVTLAQVRQQAETAFGAWRGSAPAVAKVAPPARTATHIRLINRPGAVQSGVVMGNAGLASTDPRQYALIVGNRVLGGATDSRLMHVLRDEKRWSGDAHSEIGRRQELGHYLVAAAVRAQATDQALTELGDQLDRFRTEAVPDSELTRAKNYLAGSFPRQAETNQQIAAQVATATLMGLNDDYVRTFREHIVAVTPAEVLAAAKAAAHPDSAIIVVAGDAKTIREKLAAMAPVEIVDPAGKVLTVDDLTPKPGPLNVDRSQFVSRRDSFVVIVNGSPLGTLTTETVAQGDSLSYHEALAIPVARWNLDTKASLSLGTMEMRKLDQAGSMSNQPAETHLVFAGGRVKGRAQIPQPGGTPKVTTIDTTVTPGVVDVGALALVVPGLPLEPQTSYTVFAFDAATGAVAPVQVTVLAVGNLGVPAGIFPVFQVQVMSSQPLILYITRDSPRRIVKIERMGQPMSFELVK